MDPISAINLEFVRDVRAHWSRAVADRSSGRSTPAVHAGLRDRLRTVVGVGLIVLGMWVKPAAQPVIAEQ
ncbi:MAG TPA: hypothetical protein VFU22_32030 [Roseiflexaceae bacterium]|nr:hypothetical protein [Roseiflexaceae bacterium]